MELHGILFSECILLKTNRADNLKILAQLLISGEDHRFYYHIGFDCIAILRAIYKRIFYKIVEGASTIEQQLVRVLINDYERTFRRKIQEIFLATTITYKVPKNLIPYIYLNVAYFGVGMKGIREVYKKFGLNDNDNLKIELAAEIVSLIKYPMPENPNAKYLNQVEIRKRHLQVLYNKHMNRNLFKIYR